MLAGVPTKVGRAPELAKYDILEELGVGGMATVYRGHDRRLGRDVAIKVLHPHLRENSEIAHRFAAEAKAVAKLRHRNIVEVFDVSDVGDTDHYLVAELVRGSTLRQVLARQGPLPPEIAALIVLELLSAVAHAHASGVIHRDVKPENVLIELRGAGAHDSPPADRAAGEERVHVKLTDFGIAKLLDSQGVTSTGQVLGSPAHMAPEQIEGGEVDGRADIFGLGVLFYECLVGHLPFDGSNPAQVLRRVLEGAYARAERERPVVGKVWSDIVNSALARDPSDRYPDAERMRQAIEGELGRLRVRNARSELEAWFDDPQLWESKHNERLVEVLCDLGLHARRRGAAIEAAADYNRALAYAPSNPHVLRTVAGLSRAAGRAQAFKKALPLGVLVMLLGVCSYGIARQVRRMATLPPPLAASLVKPVASAAAAPTLAENVNTVGELSQTRSEASGGGLVRSRALPREGAGRMRAVRLGSVSPMFGVRLRVDGIAFPDEVRSGLSVLVTERSHLLRFTCVDPIAHEEICVPQSVPVDAGDKEVTLDVALKILPARLTVVGDPTHRYTVDELPGVVFGAGITQDIPMTSGQKRIKVSDLTDPSLARQIVVLSAGNEKRVLFGAP